MSWVRSAAERLRALFRRRRMEADMNEELRFHIEMETEKNIRTGMRPEAARRKAMMDFGGLDRFREQSRDERGVRAVDDVMQDARYAFRQIRRYPGFSFVAILTLALGIGATTTMFSVVNGVLLNPLPFQQPDRLVLVWPQQAFSKSMVARFREESPFLEGLSAYDSQSFTLASEGDATPEELWGAAVSSNHFELLGVPPAMGRGFSREDQAPGQGQVVILSHALWERRFGADPDILGKTISLGEEEGIRRTVVGVMPPEYRPVVEVWQVWVPLEVDPSNFADFEGTAAYRLLGRVADGISLEEANLRFHEVAARLTADMEFISTEERAMAGVMPLKDALVGEVKLRLVILLASVGLVLLLACVNVANLLLVRGQGRKRELGIRLAVGAGRGRVVRQLLTESLLLGLSGGGLGLLLAYGSLPALIGILPPSTPRADLIALDGRVLVFSFAVSVLSALLFGLLPAVRATGPDLQSSLSQGGIGRRGGPSGQKLRNGLVVAELAMAVVVVVGASLLFRSLWILQHEDPGFDASHVLTIRLNLSGDRYPDDAGRLALLQEITRQVQGLNGVSEVGWASALPMAGGSMSVLYRSDDSPVSTDYLPDYAVVRVASPGFFAALRTQISQGAYPTGLTGAGDEEVVLINRSLALSLWSDGENPVGRTIWLPFGSETPARIAGVVEDFSQTSLGGDVAPEILIPYELWTPAQIYLLVRSDGNPEALVPGVRAAIWALDGDVPLAYVRTMTDVVNRTMAGSRLTTFLLLVFGGLSLALAAVGVYGVASYAVSQSTFEIGLRMALGAGREGILLGVLKRFLGVAALGISVGMAAALGASRVLASLLYQVSAADPATFLGAGLFLALVALGAVVVPAVRASRVQPARVLKEE